MYTVKTLAKLAGVTPRTLHYYDEIGLLKPSRVGDNGYRYYGEAAVLRLQQILLFRKMDVPLETIKSLMERPDFDAQEALAEHRKALVQRIVALQGLVQTVDETMLYLQGVKKMSDKQLFSGLSDEQQAEYEKEAMQTYDPEVVKASNRKWKNYSVVEKQRINDEGNQIYADLLAAMPAGAKSAQVQAIIERWRQHMNAFWTPNAEQLLGLADLYNEDPRFKANFDRLDPRLAEFMRSAVKEYVRRIKVNG
jgi:MerR family transcriptional regulator, thiopeptide resistance regulator